MKQKYTLSIADMEINVITDEPQESVERIVGILDRKIRDISLKSKRCSKNEAALLCALDFCADKMATKVQLDEAEEKLEDLNDKFEHLSEKFELVKKNGERLERDRTRLENENAKLRAILDDVRAGKTLAVEDIPAVVTEEEEAEAEIEEKVEKPAPAKKKAANKTRVGTMFDLLTFSDI
jgi:cell division protein ZapA (FtsZ GTPase activity inhibitor)